jgi:hypothetical protein
LKILDSEENWIDSKSFTVTRDLLLAVPTVDNSLSTVSHRAAGLTIGVTGRLSIDLYAALWGLTTISSSSSGGTVASVTTPGMAKSQSAVYRGFAGNSSRVPVALKRGIAKLASGFKEISSVACTGYTSGLTPSRASSALAKKRAKAVCDLVEQRFPDAKVKLVQKPAKGVGAQFRSVRIRITGN